MRYSLHLLPILILAVLTSSLQAVTLHVPGEQPTIQAGIDACVDGDTVLVADGTYTGNGNRSITFRGKAIVVMSENGPKVTIIDCQNTGRGFTFNSGEGPSSVLKGFTITNGDGGNRGGGIYCSSSSPTISNNIITGNKVEMWSWSAHGGGIYYGESSSPIIINNVISDNNVFTQGIKWESANASGGGIYCESPGGVILNNIISGNHVEAMAELAGASAYGGGIFVAYSEGSTIVNCVITNNTLHASGPMGSFVNGGGVYCSDYSDVSIANSIIWNNSSSEIYSSVGNLIVEYSDIQGGWFGVGNINLYPNFITYKGFDYLLDVGSPCIDTGDPLIEDGISDWHPRWPEWYPNGPRSDMGAYGGLGNFRWLQ